MEPMLSMRTAVVLLALAALGGLLMAGIRFMGKRNPPPWIAMLHGLLAGAGVTLLAYAVLTATVPATATIALLLFVLAALGGLVLNLNYEWNRRLLPAPLLIVHALIAVAGFVLVLFAAWA